MILTAIALTLAQAGPASGCSTPLPPPQTIDSASECIGPLGQFCEWTMDKDCIELQTPLWEAGAALASRIQCACYQDAQQNAYECVDDCGEWLPDEPEYYQYCLTGCYDLMGLESGECDQQLDADEGELLQAWSNCCVMECTESAGDEPGLRMYLARQRWREWLSELTTYEATLLAALRQERGR